MMDALISILIPRYINHKFFGSWWTGRRNINGWRSVSMLRNHYYNFLCAIICEHYENLSTSNPFWTDVINHARLSAYFFFCTIRIEELLTI